MNVDEVVSSLVEDFNQPLSVGEKRKIVFWFDKDKEFAEDIEKIQIDNVKIHHLTERNHFYTKFLLEEEDLTSHYLIYTNLELGVEDNWLIDTVLYSKTFYADKVSLLLSDLNIDSSLRGVVKKYEKFFNNKERYKKFKALGIESFNEEKIELAILSVLCNVKTTDIEPIVKTVLMDSLVDKENKYIELMGKFFDSDVFWKYVSYQYGFDHEQRLLKTLFSHLTVTALSHSIDERYIQNIKHFISERNRTNSLVFVDHWMHHKTDYEVYDEYAQMVEQDIQLTEMINQMPLEAFYQADTFPYFDRAIIIYIANSLSTNLEDYEEYIKLIKSRRAKHFYETYQYIYEALYYTVKIHQFYKDFYMGIPQGQAVDMYQSYVKQYYIMDTYYRQFYVAFDKDTNNELLKKLKTMVENIYTNWFQGELSAHWSQAVHAQLKNDWSLPGILNQQDFYQSIVSPSISKGERVFVIISDAMRYEVGVEISERLNAETLGSCEIETMLGVIPSVTKLGMASLLPHRTVDFDNNGRVYVDGKDSAGLENRKKILDRVENESIAVQFLDVFNMNKAGRREFFKGKKLIYMYHDTIDKVGESTEIYTFNAVEKAMKEIYDLVKIIRDDLSATNIYITADHGFLYQRDALEESDKIGKEKMDAIEVKRRYILSQEKREVPGLIDINLNSVIKNEEQLTAYVPNATIRFRIQGSGVNFVHGGASLQEIVVPLLKFKNKRSGQKGTKSIQKVDIKLTNTTRKITNSIFHLSFFQMEKVEEKMLPRTVVVYMADDSGCIISNEETMIVDREFDNPEDRTFKLRVVLKSMPYDKNKSYYLVIKDTESEEIVERIPFTINLGIVSDFDF